MPTRRTFLLGSLGAAVVAVVGGYAGVEEGVLPGRIRLAELTGQCDVDATPPPSGAPVETGSFASSARKTTVGWSLALPPGTPADDLPVVVVLHGRGGNHETAFKDLKLQDFLAAYTKNGGKPFALASVDGGDNTYWHPRRDGDDPITMIDDEFLPLLKKRGLHTDRIGVLGWSMGGYGALLLGSRLGPARTAAICAVSPALWTSSGATAPGAFDGADDYAANSVWGLPNLASIPIRIDCGNGDPFYAATKQFIAQLPTPPSGGFSPGGHDGAFWSSQLPAEIAWMAPILTS
jgi:S-formylglutathione hydrolase FrmB